MKTDERNIPIDVLIHRMERNSRRWERWRWIILLLALLLVLFSIYEIQWLRELQDMNSSGFFPSYGIPEPDRIGLYVDGRLELLRLELTAQFQNTLVGTVGAILLIYGFLNWNRNARSKMMIRCLREIQAKHPDTSTGTM